MSAFVTGMDFHFVNPATWQKDMLGKVPKGGAKPASILCASGLGADVTIAAFSLMVGVALEAAEKLAGEGIEAEVVNLRTLRPLDTATVIQSVRKTNRLVTVEEGWPGCGIGAEIAAQAMEQAFDHLDAPVFRVTGADVPMPYAANLEALALPNADIVAEAAKSVCYR